MTAQSRTGTIFFSIFILFIVVVLWRYASVEHRSTRTDEPTYSEFLAKVDAGDVQSVTVRPDSNVNLLEGQYLPPANHRFRLSVPKEVTPDLLNKLRDKSVNIKIKDDHAADGDLILILLNAAPLILLAGFCLYLVFLVRGKPARLTISQNAIFRTGIGYDLHRLESGRPLIVGGIELPFDKGPMGHSDGDVLAHALCDALLGAAGLGDIGKHFPDTDPEWKGANSLMFLERTKKFLDDKKFVIQYIDAVVILERPKLGPHFPKMRDALAKSLGISVDQIHLKAKTNEAVDAVGRGEAIACYVVATLAAPSVA